MVIGVRSKSKSHHSVMTIVRFIWPRNRLELGLTIFMQANWFRRSPLDYS